MPLVTTDGGRGLTRNPLKRRGVVADKQSTLRRGRLSDISSGKQCVVELSRSALKGVAGCGVAMASAKSALIRPTGYTFN